MATRIGRPPLYRWDEWFKKEKFTLALEKDFRCSRESIVQQLRDAASSRGLSINVTLCQNGKVMVKVIGGGRTCRS